MWSCLRCLRCPPCTPHVCRTPPCAHNTHSQAACPRAPLQLILRAINSSKSAFMAVTLNARFFDSYSVINAAVVQAGVLLKARGARRMRLALQRNPEACTCACAWA